MNKKADIILALTFSLAFLLFTLGILLTHLHSSPTGFAIAGITNGSIGNQSYLNCTVVQNNTCAASFTKILGLYNYTNSHVEFANESGFNYSLCCAATTGGITINTTDTNDSSSVNFLNLYQNNNSHVEIPNGSIMSYFNGSNLTTVHADPYNLSAFISADNGFLSCNSYENLYGNCTYENETCLLTVPVNLTANTTNMHVASCNQTQAYDTSICCSLLPSQMDIYIDGNETNFTNAGEPYNVTIETIPNVIIRAEECNSITHFSLLQSIDSNVTNCAYTHVQTDSSGRVSYTHVPTGGEPNYNSPFDYTIKFQRMSGDSVQSEKELTLVNRAPPSASSKGSLIVNKPNVEGTNERILIVFDRISRSRLSGSVAGEKIDMVFYDNGTSSGTNVTLTSGRPTALNITVLNSTDQSPLSNVSIKIKETSGLMHWGLIQYESAGATTNVSNYVEGTVTTSNNGMAYFTVVPTAGFVSAAVDQAIGNYAVNLRVILPNATSIFNNNLSIDRSLPSPSPTSSISNSGEIEGFNEKVLVLYDRVSISIS